MLAQARRKSIHWMVLAALALGPTAVFAQQETAPRVTNQQDKAEETPKQAENTPTKTEEGPKQTEAAQAQTEKAKVISGMSILGNQEAPKSLVIVPWKSSELGNVLGITTKLDDSRQPIDKEVFMRMLSYYDIRSESASAGVAPADKNAAQTATAALRRKQ